MSDEAELVGEETERDFRYTATVYATALIDEGDAYPRDDVVVEVVLEGTVTCSALDAEDRMVVAGLCHRDAHARVAVGDHEYGPGAKREAPLLRGVPPEKVTWRVLDQDVHVSDVAPAA